MQIDKRQTRDIEAAAADVGALLGSLGSDDDRLWPSHRWATPFELDGDLAAGSPARHGAIRYAVEVYEPGRRLTFRFAPGVGLDGTHGFEIESLDDGRARLSHFLRARVEKKLIPLWPLLSRSDRALAEDILAQAERAATGRPVPQRRLPLWMRAADALEARLVGRPKRARGVAGVAVPVTLGAIAVLHAAWALGWHWPGGSEPAQAERVLSGSATEMPPGWASWVVALALTVAAASVRATAGGETSPAVRRLTWLTAGVLVVRGAVYPPLDLANGLAAPYDRLDLAIYSPLCLALGLGAAAVARRAPVSAAAPAPGSRAALR